MLQQPLKFGQVCLVVCRYFLSHLPIWIFLGRGDQASNICTAVLHADSWLRVWATVCDPTFKHHKFILHGLDPLFKSLQWLCVLLIARHSQNTDCYHSQIKSQWDQTTSSFYRHYAFLCKLVSWLFVQNVCHILATMSITCFMEMSLPRCNFKLHVSYSSINFKSSDLKS